jgi:hypothetical protein
MSRLNRLTNAAMQQDNCSSVSELGQLLSDVSSYKIQEKLNSEAALPRSYFHSGSPLLVKGPELALCNTASAWSDPRTGHF